MRLQPIAVLVFASLGGQAQNQVSIEKEAALGRQLVAEFQERTTVIDQSRVVGAGVVEAYLDLLGRRLAAFVPAARFPFTLRLIADDPCGGFHEAVSFPAGHVFVPASLILAAQDEAELAGMLARGMHRTTQRGETSLGTVPLIFVGGCQVPHSFETRDDVSAVATMAGAGFDPQALVRYLERLHSPAARIASLSQAIRQRAPSVYTRGPAGEFAVIQEEVRRLVPQRASSGSSSPR